MDTWHRIGCKIRSDACSTENRGRAVRNDCSCKRFVHCSSVHGWCERRARFIPRLRLNRFIQLRGTQGKLKLGLVQRNGNSEFDSSILG